mgnify:CR=1 FL=1
MNHKKYKLVFPWTENDLKNLKNKSTAELIEMRIIEAR